MLSITSPWEPIKPVTVDATAIPETPLIDVHVVLDRVPDDSWRHLFLVAAQRRRASDDRMPWFLGRYICLQPTSADVNRAVSSITSAVDEANARYIDDVLVVRHTSKVTAAV